MHVSIIMSYYTLRQTETQPKTLCEPFSRRRKDLHPRFLEEIAEKKRELSVILISVFRNRKKLKMQKVLFFH